MLLYFYEAYNLLHILQFVIDVSYWLNSPLSLKLLLHLGRSVTGGGWSVEVGGRQG